MYWIDQTRKGEYNFPFIRTLDLISPNKVSFIKNEFRIIRFTYQQLFGGEALSVFQAIGIQQHLIHVRALHDNMDEARAS